MSSHLALFFRYLKPLTHTQTDQKQTPKANKPCKQSPRSRLFLKTLLQGLWCPNPPVASVHTHTQRAGGMKIAVRKAPILKRQMMKERSVRLGVKPAPTSHMLKYGVSGRSQLDGPHTPFKMWSDWLFLCIKGIVMHCSLDSWSPETFSSVLPCLSYSLLTLAFSLILQWSR